MFLAKCYNEIRLLFMRGYIKVFLRKKIKLGKSVRWRKCFTIQSLGKGIFIGNNVFFNNNCSLISRGTISIGDGTLFGENVKIYDHNHRFADIKKSIKENGFSVGEIKIGKHCWIASNVCILKGAQIGDNCVIGAGCVISGHIQDNTIVKQNQNYLYEHLQEL